jgi:MFS transporter, Spinster family, sphingosine-1-phosphate transporter
MVCAIPIPYTNGYWSNVICLWLLLFFGGAILPSLTGIMLSTVTLSQKTAANSVANLLYNCAGFMPGPFVYGAIDDAYGGGRTAMKFLMFTPCVCISALYLASYFIFRDDVLGFNKHKK